MADEEVDLRFKKKFKKNIIQNTETDEKTNEKHKKNQIGNRTDRRITTIARARTQNRCKQLNRTSPRESVRWYCTYTCNRRIARVIAFPRSKRICQDNNRGERASSGHVPLLLFSLLFRSLSQPWLVRQRFSAPALTTPFTSSPYFKIPIQTNPLTFLVLLWFVRTIVALGYHEHFRRRTEVEIFVSINDRRKCM